ncbi:MAG: hypothetical protein MI741_19430, partial [Rhodospirillales bacterium]|nr:hypothetical protein [Rhodospirillales bacterium]
MRQDAISPAIDRFHTHPSSRHIGLFTLLLSVTLSSAALAQDWPRFLGPNGNAAVEAGAAPLKWSGERNMLWKTKLPGPGTSCP